MRAPTHRGERTGDALGGDVPQYTAALPPDLPIEATITPFTYMDGAPAIASTKAPIPALSQLLASDAGAAETPHERSDFELLDQLGRGGMGRVLLARQRSLGREVAIKVLLPDACDGAADMLFAEALVTGRIEHPNVIPVHQVGLDAAGRPVLVMKRVQGTSWSTLLQSPDHPRWSRLRSADDDRLAANIEILIQVAGALDHAHQLGFVHRDVKTDNVMIGEHGEVYLADWGIARALDQAPAKDGEMVVGTPGYMAPEMLEASLGGITPATDVYLLGATLHRILTGRPRHAAESIYASFGLALRSEPYAYAPAVPDELASIANRATARDPATRFASAWELRDVLADYLRHRGSVALARATEERLQALEALLAQPDAGDEERDARARSLAAECRFGFAQALAGWGANARASQGLRRTIELLLERELSRRNARGARDLLSELGAPSAEHVARVGALEAEQEEERRRAEAHRRLEAEHDPSIGAGARAATFAAMLVPAIAVSVHVGLGWGERHGELTPTETIAFPAIVMLVAVCSALLVRRRLLANALGRQVTAAMGSYLLAILVHRAVALSLGASTAVILSSDLVLLAFVGALLGATTVRWGFWLAPIGLVGALTIAIAPQHTLEVFTVAATFGLLVCLVAVSRSWRSPHRSP